MSAAAAIPPPLVFIYDRSVTHNPEPLRARLERCHAYAESHGWELGRDYIDRGDNALSDGHRPEWWAMVRAVEAHRGRPVVVLVHDWDRITRNPVASSALRYHVARAGGHCETAEGECDALDSRTAGLVTTPPAVTP